MIFLCIDAGTTNIKAALVRDTGEFIDVESKSIYISMPKIGVCEMDMDELWSSICEVINLLRIKNKSIWHEIEGIGVCAQGDGAWLIDEEHKPFRPAVLWNDTRNGTISAGELNDINKNCIEMNTTPLFSGAFPVIMKWLKMNEPENYKKTRWILHCKDWINFKLTGNISTDTTDASTAAFDIFHKNYRNEILEMLDIGEIRDCLPKVLNSSQIMGSLSEECSLVTGIRLGIPVIAGAIDVLSVATGCSLVEPGQKGSIIGTTLSNFIVLDECSARELKNEKGSILCHTKPGRYIRQMSALSGASTLDWIRKEIAEGTTFDYLESKLKEIPIGSNGVVFLPFLFGERAPFRIPNASASFIGLRVNHTKYDMIRASFESLAMVLYDCYQNLPESNPGLIVAGGGANNELLSQMISDTLGETVTRIDLKELGILGVLRLLKAGLIHGDDQNETGLKETYPILENHENYMKLYETYGKWKDVMISNWI